MGQCVQSDYPKCEGRDYCTLSVDAGQGDGKSGWEWTKREKLDYEATCADCKKICGNKVTESVSVRDRLRQKEQVVKEREASRVHRARQKDKGAR